MSLPMRLAANPISATAVRALPAPPSALARLAATPEPVPQPRPTPDLTPAGR